MPHCAVCETDNVPGTLHCKRCGADMFDPGVAAALEAPGKGPAPAAISVDDADPLTHGTVFGVGIESLRGGRALSRLALLAGILLLALFALPVDRVEVYGWSGSTKQLVMSWQLLSGPEARPLLALFPLAGGILALLVAFIPGLPSLVRAIVLAAIGAVGLALVWPAVNRLGNVEAARWPLSPYAAGLMLCALGLTYRIRIPAARPGRLLAVAGLALMVLGLAIPMGAAGRFFPRDIGYHGVGRGEPAIVFLVHELGSHYHGQFFTTPILVIPIVLAPIATALAWALPDEIWDARGRTLRPMVWVLVTAPILLHATLAFNMFGWEWTRAYLLGRTRALFLVTACTLLLHFSALAVIDAALRRSPSRPAPG